MRLEHVWWNTKWHTYEGTQNGTRMMEHKMTHLWWNTKWHTYDGTQNDIRMMKHKMAHVWWNTKWHTYDGTQSGTRMMEHKMANVWWNTKWHTYVGTQNGTRMTEHKMTHVWWNTKEIEVTFSVYWPPGRRGIQLRIMEFYLPRKTQNISREPKAYKQWIIGSYVYWTVHHLDNWVKRDQLDVTCFIISSYNAQHVSDINTSILRSLRLMCLSYFVGYIDL